MFDIQYDDRAIVAKFNEMPERLHNELLRSIFGLADQLKSHIASQKLNGQLVNRVTGRLANSIQRRVTDTPNEIMAQVYSNDTALPYNRALNNGATIPDRFPKKAKALHFFIGGKEVFAKKARGFTLKPRRYMESGLSDFKTIILKDLQEATRRATQ